MTDTSAAPHDLDAEQAVLGLILTHGAPALHAAENHLTADDFYRPQHAALWQLCRDLTADGAPIDPITVRNALPRLNGTARGIDAPYLHTLAADAPLAGSIGHYARIIAEHATRRRTQAIATRLAQRAAGPDLDAALTEARQALEQEARQAEHGPDRRPVDWASVWANPPQPPEPLAEPLLYRGRVTWLYAPTGVGKSLLSMEIAAALATGRPALATGTAQLLNVLYVDQENTVDDWLDRLTDMGYAGADLTGLTLHCLADWAAFDTPDGGAQLAAEADRTRADLIVLDTVSKCVSGEENANDTYQALYRHTMLPLKRAGRAVLCLDHPGKDIERGARGASSKGDNVDLRFEMLQRGPATFSLTRTKARFRHPQEVVWIRRDSTPLMHRVETVDEHTIELVMACLVHIRRLAPESGTKATDVVKMLREEGTGFRKQTVLDAYRAYQKEQRWDS